MNPLVSIIITNYNYGRFLAEAIESALAQTWQDREILFIDDGSTDDSVEIARRYPITVLSQKNSGVCIARNNALSVARGEYVMFLDADDRLVPTAVEHMLARLREAPADVGYVYGQMQYFGVKTGLFASQPFDPRKLAKANFICATTLLRKQVIVDAGGYDDGFRMLREDWELYLRLWSRGYRGEFLPEVILEYRKHKGPTVGTSPTKALTIAMLIRLYPGLMWRHLLRHPWRYGSRLLFGGIESRVGRYGPHPNDFHLTNLKQSLTGHVPSLPIQQSPKH